MPPADSADDPGFEDALSEAVDSLREGHPDAELPGETPHLQTVVEALSASGRESELRTDAARLLGMLAEQFPGELARVAPAVADEVSEESGRRHLLLVLGYVSKVHPEAVEDSIEPVVAALDDDDPAVVRNAIWVLTNLAEEDREITTDVLPELLELVAHDDDEVRRRAASALGSVPEPVLAETPAVLERVLEQLESSSHYRTAGRTLVSIAPAYGDRSVDALFDLVENGRSATREHAAWTLAPLSDEHPELVRPRWPALVELVREDDDYQVKNGAAAALAAIVRDDPVEEPLRALIRLLDHEDEFVRRYGCLALGDVAVASGDPSALEALAEARDDETHVVRREAERLFADAAREHPDAVSEIDADIVERPSDGSSR